MELHLTAYLGSIIRIHCFTVLEKSSHSFLWEIKIMKSQIPDTTWRRICYLKNVRASGMVPEASIPASKLNYLPLAGKERENRGPKWKGWHKAFYSSHSLSERDKRLGIPDSTPARSNRETRRSGGTAQIHAGVTLTVGTLLPRGKGRGRKWPPHRVLEAGQGPDREPRHGALDLPEGLWTPGQGWQPSSDSFARAQCSHSCWHCRDEQLSCFGALSECQALTFHASRNRSTVRL